MAVLHFEIPRGRLSQVTHHPGRSAVSDWVGHMLATIREWRRRARDRAELARLDDRMLKDIGLARGDAEFLSNKPFWKE